MAELYKIQHLRGTTAQWATNNIIPAEGELAVEVCADGKRKIKIGDGVTAFASLAYFGTQATAHEISITSGEWSGNSVTKNVTGVTADCIVIVAPLPASQDRYVNAKIKCTAQGAGTLTFTCTATPLQTITIGVVIIK